MNRVSFSVRILADGRFTKPRIFVAPFVVQFEFGERSLLRLVIFKNGPDSVFPWMWLRTKGKAFSDSVFDSVSIPFSASRYYHSSNLLRKTCLLSATAATASVTPFFPAKIW
jgi:hypothetical protein